MSIHSDPVEFALPSRWLFGGGTLINDQGDEDEYHLFIFLKSEKFIILVMSEYILRSKKGF